MSPPTKDNCGGKYNLNNPIGNFGDPVCDFDKQKMGAQLQQEDAANAQRWDSIIECESTYNPNAHASHESIGTPDAAGAWGLSQMGRGKNGQFDHGDVNWSLQISNMINYNKQIGGSFKYWACARSGN